ncbi:MAG: hypothetical protein QM778_27630 [Myxococcales bacterium]
MNHGAARPQYRVSMSYGGLGSKRALQLGRVALVAAWGLLLGPLAVARAEAVPVYITAKAADPELKLEALEVAALARAALLEAQGFDWQTADSRVRGAQSVARAAQKRALAGLRRGRQAYLKLELDAAVADFRAALIDWGAAQPVLDSPEPVAETLMYLGACHVLADDRERAAEVFTRYHQQFATVRPNSGLFNPAIMQQWEAAGAALRKRPTGTLDVRVKPASAVVSVDGLARGTGNTRVPQVPPGRHWVRGAGLGSEGRTLEVVVESGRVASANLGELSDSAVLLDLFEHASSPKGAQALAQELGVRALGVIEVRRGEKPGELALDLRSFEGESGREQAAFQRVLTGALVERSQAMRGLVAAWLDRVLNDAPHAPRPVARTSATRQATPAVAMVPPTSERSRHDEAKPVWYRRWWVWAIAGGALAAGAITTALVVQNRDDAPPAPSDKGTLVLQF